MGILLGRFLKEPTGSGTLAPEIPTGEESGAIGPWSSAMARWAGRSTRLLRENQIEPVIIELNLETVRGLKAEGIAAVYGDAAHRETLEQAGLRDARALLLSSSQTSGTHEAIRLRAS